MNLKRASALLLTVCSCTHLSAVADKISDYDWPSYANDPGSSKYADLDQINRKTIKQLQIAWVWDSVDNEMIKNKPEHVPLGFKSTPIKIGKVLYTSTSLGHVVALDAISGEQLWVFDTRTYEHGRPANMGFNHRGVAYWEEGDKRRIIMGTNNGFLWSLDADTGMPDPDFGEGGKTDLTLGLGRKVIRSFYSVVAPPVIIDGIIVVGSVVADIPFSSYSPKARSDMPPGHIRGFDVRSGKQKWIFHTIPQAGEPGNETWENESWRDTGATNVWSMMSVDHDLGYVYLPLGTPNNDWYGGHRLGDNLFGESIICLKASTGELIWHYQTVHHGLWDYDLPAAPNLVDISVAGRDIKALVQVSKQGFVYVLNRVTGEPVWPIEEKPVPKSQVPGERAALSQPFPSVPAPFEPQGLTEDSLINFTLALRAEALEIIKQFDHGPLFTPPSLRGTIQIPGDGGGAEWTGAAFDPDTSLLYIPSITRPIVVQLVKPKNNDAYRYVRGGTTGIRGPKNLPLLKPPYSRISAINLNTGEYKWVVPNGEGIRQKIIKMGIADPGPVGSLTLSSPLLTRSFLFIALSDGGSGLFSPSGNHVLRALDKQSGAIVHEVKLPSFPQGAPMTYMAGGKQYISVAVGGSSDAKLVTLALP